LLKIGWTVKSHKGSSHYQLQHRENKYPEYTWAFHDNVEIGPKMLSKIAKNTGLKPEDL
jgi:predicted RNA binding protein YcfA (HicA-like mRNA interferase family)